MAVLDRREIKSLLGLGKHLCFYVPGKSGSQCSLTETELLFLLIFLSKGSNKPSVDVAANLMTANVIISVPSGILLQIYPFTLIAVDISVRQFNSTEQIKEKAEKDKSFFPLHLIGSFPTTCVAVIGLESYLYSNA